MGCNESKHSVATDTTAISRRKSPFRKKSDKRINCNNIINPLQTTPESEANAAAKQPESDDAVVVADVNSVKDEEDQAVKVIRSNIKEIELLAENSNSNNNSDHIDNKVIKRDSPDHYFSSRKDEVDAVESVVTEDGYYSPNHDESVKVDVETRERDEDGDEDHEASHVESGLVEEEEITPVQENDEKPVQEVAEAVATKETEVTLPSSSNVVANVVTKFEDKQTVHVVTEQALPSGLQPEENNSV